MELMEQYWNTEYFADTIYPLTIITDRYGGTYSGGKYTAWNCYSDEIPSEVDATDIACMIFWDCFSKETVGIGNTIFEAILDLYIKLNYGGEENASINC